MAIKFYISAPDNLNFFQYYQQNRDLAEGVLQASYNEQCPEYGFLSTYRIYQGQYNIIDALFYGICFLKMLLRKNRVFSMVLKKCIQDTFIFYRNFQLIPLAEGVYGLYKDKINLDDYEKQKWDVMNV